MKVKMPWLKARLRELDRTPTGLAQHLGIHAPRVYEMIAGRRGMQPNEIAPTATYLEWSVEQILQHLPEKARVLPVGAVTVSAAPNTAGMSAVLGAIRVFTTMRSPTNCRYHKPGNVASCDMVLTGETVQSFEPLPALKGRDDIMCLYLHSSSMAPWRDRGEMVLVEMKRPPKDLDHVVIYLVLDDPEKPTPVLVRQLLKQTASKLKVRQYNPMREGEIDMKTVASIHRVLTWDDVIR